jgi:serine/threonine protein phosphatase PrpC
VTVATLTLKKFRAMLSAAAKDCGENPPSGFLKSIMMVNCIKVLSLVDDTFSLHHVGDCRAVVYCVHCWVC